MPPVLRMPPMSSTVPACRTINVVAFRGDRSRAFAAAVLGALDDEKNGRGPGASVLDCLLFAGHTGVSLDGGTTIYGFNPDGGGNPVWHLLNGLKNGDGFPGVVRGDTGVFTAAQNHGLQLLAFEVILPDPRFQDFQRALDAERRIDFSRTAWALTAAMGKSTSARRLQSLGITVVTSCGYGCCCSTLSAVFPSLATVLDVSAYLWTRPKPIWTGPRFWVVSQQRCQPCHKVKAGMHLVLSADASAPVGAP